MTNRFVFAFCVMTLLYGSASAAFAETGKSLGAGLATSIEFPKGISEVTIPVHMFLGGIPVVRVRIGSRDMDFAIDSGSASTILNAKVYDSLGLGGPSHAGSATTTLNLGTLALTNITIVSSPVSWEVAGGTKIVGLLGYDLLAHAIVRLDYENASLVVKKPESFEPPANAVMIPVDMTGLVPIARASVGSAVGDRFLVETGSFAITVLPHFTNAHPEVFNARTERNGLEYESDDDVLRFEPACSSMQETRYTREDFHLGVIAVPDWHVLAPQHECSDAGSLDGLIGYDFLRLFTVTFDLHASRIYFEPLPRYSTSVDTPQQPR